MVANDNLWLAHSSEHSLAEIDGNPGEIPQKMLLLSYNSAGVAPVQTSRSIDTHRFGAHRGRSV